MQDNPYTDIRATTPLGSAVVQHNQRHRHDPTPGFKLGNVEIGSLDACWKRSRFAGDEKLAELCEAMSDMLQHPDHYPVSYCENFSAIFYEAFMRACPLASALNDQFHKLSGLSWDHTLFGFDMAKVYDFEQHALSDQTMRSFVDDMVERLQRTGDFVDQKAYRQVFEIYSEALAYRLLQIAGGDKLRIEKIGERDDSTPDFHCTLDSEGKPIEFYIEMKTLDIVHADQRHAEILDDGTIVRDNLNRQLEAGKCVAMAEGEVAPYRKYRCDKGYDPRSVRMTIDVLIEKCRRNFNTKQFQLGPTFALVNLLRMPIHGEGKAVLSPYYYDSFNGGACVSGSLWHLAFGQVGAPVHRTPEFEGAGTYDGNLTSEGILIGHERLPAPGILVLRREHDEYRLDGLYDAYWTDKQGWSNLQTEFVFTALCKNFNDGKNSMAHELSLT
jgi:hypothetical protein